MASRADTLDQRRQKRFDDAAAMLADSTTIDLSTPDKIRHARERLIVEMQIELAGELGGKRAGRRAVTAAQLSGEETRRSIAALATDVRPTARQRFVDATFVDAAGDLLPSVKQRLTRELAAGTRAEERAQVADSRAAFERQRGVLARGTARLATRQQSRAMNTRTPMPVRRTTRKPAAKMWVTPTGRVTTMAAHRKRSAASRAGARSGGLIGRPRANMPRRGGAFASPSTMIREAAASALKNVMSKYVKPTARKAVKAGSRWAKGAGHRAVNSLSKSGEAALLNMIGSGLNLPGVPRRRVGGMMARRISRVPGSFRPQRAMYGSGIRLATGRRIAASRRPAGRR
jgi:hypothetical protein